jgi:hypothetical protein
MSKKEEDIKRQVERHQAWIEFVARIPDDLYESEIDSINDECRIFLNTVKTLDEAKGQLRKFISLFGSYKIVYYYVSTFGLSVQAVFGDTAIIAYITEAESALEVLSRGKCHIKTEAITEKRVVCSSK